MKLVAILLCCLHCAAQEHPMSYDYRVQAAAPVDGDTVKADLDLGFDLTYHADVRIVGVDTPEMSKVVQRAAAVKALAFVTAWFTKHKGAVTCRSITWDKYGGRVLGDFWSGDERLGDAIVKAGYGRLYNGEKKAPWTAEQLAAIEKLP